MSIPAQQLGWMAGVIDLKGRIVEKRNKTRNTRQLTLYVQTKELAVVRKLSSLTGTKPEISESRATKDWMRRACNEHCPEPHVHVWAMHDEYPFLAKGGIVNTSKWTMTGASMAVILHNVLPFLVIDRGYTDALDYVMNSAVFDGQGAGATVKAIRRLIELGWDLPEQFEIAMENYVSKVT